MHIHAYDSGGSLTYASLTMTFYCSSESCVTHLDVPYRTEKLCDADPLGYKMPIFTRNRVVNHDKSSSRYLTRLSISQEKPE